MNRSQRDRRRPWLAAASVVTGGAAALALYSSVRELVARLSHRERDASWSPTAPLYLATSLFTLVAIRRYLDDREKLETGDDRAMPAIALVPAPEGRPEPVTVVEDEVAGVAPAGEFARQLSEAHERLNEIFHGDQERIARLIAMSHESLLDGASAVGLALTKRDGEAAARTAHRMKGVALEIGFDALAGIATTIQVAAHARAWDEAEHENDRFLAALAASTGLEREVA